MSKRGNVTEGLSLLLERRLRSENKRFAREVKFSNPSCRIDYVSFKFAVGWDGCIGGVERGTVSCYEIKSCVADYRSGNGLNFLGDDDFLVMPVETALELTGERPADVGYYFPVPHGSTLAAEFRNPTSYHGEVDGWSLHIKRSPYKQIRNLPLAEMLAQMIYAGIDRVAWEEVSHE